MKKLVSLSLAGLVVLALSGCGGGGGGVIIDNGPIPETFFITDGFGDGVGGIIYHCDSGFAGVTNFEGAFSFDIIGDNCNFDLVTNGISDELFLEYDNDPFTDAGINGIAYICLLNGTVVSSGDTRYDALTDLNGFIDEGSLYDGCTLLDIH